jgi:Outer membrane protein and related peptidoglycan-associated (lipo)proteins
MGKSIYFFCTVLFAALVLSTGCAKKVTKVEPQAKPAPQHAPAPKVEEAPVVTQPDSFKVEDIDAKMKEIFLPIYFSYDKYNLSSEAIGTLEKVASFMKEKTNVRILIEGNADERGSSEYNMGLGDNRARAVKNYLTGYGISGNRLETTSYGKERPAFPNCGEDESCHSKNRRDEWKLLGK